MLVELSPKERTAIVDALVNDAALTLRTSEHCHDEEDHNDSVRHAEWLRDLASRILLPL